MNEVLVNANDFLEAANRCSFEKANPEQGIFPLLIPERVNLAFACELYTKAIAKARNIDISKIHKLNMIFKKFTKDDQKALFDKWRENAGERMPDCDYTRKMFFDNLEAVSDVFMRFRYAHEWAGSTINLESSFTPEQFAKLSKFSPKRPLGSPPIYSGFLLEFANSLKNYAEQK